MQVKAGDLADFVDSMAEYCGEPEMASDIEILKKKLSECRTVLGEIESTVSGWKWNSVTREDLKDVAGVLRENLKSECILDFSMKSTP